MNNFIVLTDIENNRKLIVNVNHILYISEDVFYSLEDIGCLHPLKCTLIRFSYDQNIYVKESLEEIIEMINNSYIVIQRI